MKNEDVDEVKEGTTSHDWARSLQRVAEFILSKPAVEINRIPITQLGFYSNKDPFIALVRATKPGSKNTTQFHVNFRPTGCPDLEIYVNRDLVCKRITPEYE